MVYDSLFFPIPGNMRCHADESKRSAQVLGRQNILAWFNENPALSGV